jgi:ubiquinone/menaquinone biosynthesis C-methylase UbiE
MDTRAALIEGYSDSAPLYDQVAGGIYLGALRKYFLPRLSVSPAPAVLDLGCGTGINLLEVARVLGDCSRLHGVDLAPGMIAEARRKAADEGVCAVFEVGDAQGLSFEDESFDLVICNSVYHWFPDRQRAVAEMSRVLRPGGQVLLSTVVSPGYDEWFHAIDDVRGRLLDEPLPERRGWCPPLPTTTELTDHLRGAGLTVEYLVLETERFPVRDPMGFLRLMTVISPTWLAGVPSGKVHAAMTAASEVLSVESEDGPFVVTAAGVATVSRKPLH